MLAKNLVRAVQKRGGTAEITEREYVGGYEVSGELNGYDVHMYLCNGGQPEDGGNSYYTVRAIRRRGENNPSSDYNPGGWTFCNRLTDLDWSAR